MSATNQNQRNETSKSCRLELSSKRQVVKKEDFQKIAQSLSFPGEGKPRPEKTPWGHLLGKKEERPPGTSFCICQAAVFSCHYVTRREGREGKTCQEGGEGKCLKTGPSGTSGILLMENIIVPCDRPRREEGGHSWPLHLGASQVECNDKKGRLKCQELG